MISLLSSSPEPEPAEDYAYDSVDETYVDPDMPTGGANKRPKSRSSIINSRNAALLSTSHSKQNVKSVSMGAQLRYHKKGTHNAYF